MPYTYISRMKSSFHDVDRLRGVKIEKNSQASTCGECTDDFCNAGTKREAHAGTKNPTPYDRGRTTDEEGSIERRRDTRAEAHDAESKAYLQDIQLRFVKGRV